MNEPGSASQVHTISRMEVEWTSTGYNHTDKQKAKGVRGGGDQLHFRIMRCNCQCVVLAGHGHEVFKYN